jgi:hypothetical protein
MHSVAMRSAIECSAKADDLEKRALDAPEPDRAHWLEMAAHWRRLAIQAIGAKTFH